MHSPLTQAALCSPKDVPRCAWRESLHLFPLLHSKKVTLLERQSSGKDQLSWRKSAWAAPLSSCVAARMRTFLVFYSFACWEKRCNFLLAFSKSFGSPSLPPSWRHEEPCQAWFKPLRRKVFTGMRARFGQKRRVLLALPVDGPSSTGRLVAAG